MLTPAENQLIVDQVKEKMSKFKQKMPQTDGIAQIYGLTDHKVSQNQKTNIL